MERIIRLSLEEWNDFLLDVVHALLDNKKRWIDSMAEKHPDAPYDILLNNAIDCAVMVVKSQWDIRSSDTVFVEDVPFSYELVRRHLDNMSIIGLFRRREGGR